MLDVDQWPSDEASVERGTVKYAIQSYGVGSNFKAAPLNNATDSPCDVPPLVVEAPPCLQFARLSVPAHAMRPLNGSVSSQQRARNLVRALACVTVCVCARAHAMPRCMQLEVT
jgi:hypothetical protein